MFCLLAFVFSRNIRRNPDFCRLTDVAVCVSDGIADTDVVLFKLVLVPVPVVALF